MVNEILVKRIDSFVMKQAPPGPPPRLGLVWNPQTRRWRHPETSIEYYPSGERTRYGQYTLEQLKHELEMEKRIFHTRIRKPVGGWGPTGTPRQRARAKMDEIKEEIELRFPKIKRK